MEGLKRQFRSTLRPSDCTLLTIGEGGDKEGGIGIKREREGRN